jgi:hypothetical protein
MLNRNRIGRALRTAVLLVILTPQFVWAWEEREEKPIRALQRYPHLEDFFPYGFWYAQAPMDETLTGQFRETYEQRRAKLFHHLARHHINTLITANRLARPEALDAAGQHDMRLISSAEFLHSHVNHAGELTGEATMEQVKQRASDHARKTKDDPHLLAYLVFDEPRAKVAPKIRQVLDVFRKADPNHPAIYTHSDMPLDRSRTDGWRMLQSQDVLLSDCYSIAARSGRDPWLYGDVYIPELRRANPDALQWPIVQAFTKPYTIWALPTPAELRVMVYHTLASGAKGMFFFTTNQAYLGSWARREWFCRGAGNPWYGKEELMDEIGRIGAHLTTAGPLLIPLRYAPDYMAYVGADSSGKLRGGDSPLSAPETFQAYVLGASSEAGGGGGLRRNGELQRPAIHVGAFSGVDYDVLVVHNNDPWTKRRGSVTLSKQRKNVLDLVTLERVPLSRSEQGTTFSASFKPGDGRRYLFGSDSAVDAARDTVLKRRGEHKIRLLRLDAELAKRGGVDIGPVEKLLERAAESEAPATALDLLNQARLALGKAEAAARDYSAIRNMIETARENFDQIHIGLHGAPIHPLDEDSAPPLRRLGQRVIEMGRSFSANENAFRAGKLDVTAAYVLRRETTQFRDDVLGYRPDRLIEKSIAVVELSGVAEFAQNSDALAKPSEVLATSVTHELGGPEARALTKRLRWMFADVAHLTARADGRIVDARGEEADLSKLDLIWFHVGGRSAAAQSRYCVSANLATGIPHQRTTESLRQFLDDRGGLVLSGLAACLAPDLDLEAYPPNHRFWGTMLVPGHGPSRHRPATRPNVKSLGLKPVVTDHPLFAGLPADGFQTMEFNAAELVTEAVWQRPPGHAESWRAPQWPQKGRVLASYWADGLDIPRNYAAVVEYKQKGGGKAILLGGAFDPRVSTHRPRRGQHYDRLIRNVVDYCSRGEAATKK